MRSTDQHSTDDHADTPRHTRFAGRTFIAAAALLAAGGATGAAVMSHTRPSVSMAPATPIAIHALSPGGIVTVAGRVAEIYGNKFILADATGRALVDTGREGEDGGLVTPGEAVQVQGRFDHGFLRAAFLVGPDRKVLALAPLGGPPHDRHGPDGDRGPGGPPPPPPGTGRAAPPPPPAAALATARETVAMAPAVPTTAPAR